MVTSDAARLAWEYTEEKLRRLRNESEGFTARLHNEYFLPFDQLLERKAEYALKVEQEKGEIPPRLLAEIEVMEKLRSYVAALEALTDERLMTAWIHARRDFENLARTAITWQQIAEHEMENTRFFIELYQNERSKHQKNGVSPRQDH